MATTSVVNSTLMGIYVNVSGTWTKVAHATDASVSLSHEPRDITTKDSAGWRELLEGLRSFSVSGSGLFAEDAAYGLNDLDDLLINRTEASIRFMTNVTGDTLWQGDVYFTSIDKTSSGAEDNVTFSFSAEGTGALTISAITT
jgi:predicted secreted protein